MKHIETQPFLEIQEQLGDSISKALSETALELGGEELQERVLTAASLDNGFPNPRALMLLNAEHPGSAELAIDRAFEIEKLKMAADEAVASSPQTLIQRIGSVAAEGFKYSIFGRPR